jgi:hypothetical protein
MDFGKFSDNTNASIQFSYPAVNNVTYEKGTSSFFLPNNSVTPNFSYTDSKNNLYISGASIRGYIRQNNPVSLTKSSRELVLEHQQANSDKKFYVVIPIETNSTSKTTLSKLKENSKIILDLNSDISNQNTIYHYMSTPGNIRVFVFGTPITVKPDFFAGGNVPIGLPVPTSLPTTGVTQQFKIKSPTKVEDEIVCGYSEDAPVKPGQDKTATTVAISFGSLLLNIVLLVIFLYLFKNYGDNLLSNDMLHVFVIFACLIIWGIVFGLFLWFAKEEKTNYTIITGSLLFTATFMFSVIFFPDSDYSKMVKAATVVTPAATTAATAAATAAAAATAPIPRGLFSASSLITGRHP